MNKDTEESNFIKFNLRSHLENNFLKTKQTKLNVSQNNFL